jgi:hypothetical protein
MNYLSSKFLVAAFTIVFVMYLACLPCHAQAKQPPCSDGWIRVKAKERFTFCLPPDMKQSNTKGIESYFRQYTRENLRILFDYNPYDFLSYDARHESDMLNYEEEEIRLDGRKANIRTYQISEKGRTQYEASLHVGDWEKSQVELEMFVGGDSPHTIEIAKKIFRSIDFLEEKRNPKNSLRQTHTGVSRKLR